MAIKLKWGKVRICSGYRKGKTTKSCWKILKSTLFWFSIFWDANKCFLGYGLLICIKVNRTFWNWGISLWWKTNYYAWSLICMLIRGILSVIVCSAELTNIFLFRLIIPDFTIFDPESNFPFFSLTYYWQEVLAKNSIMDNKSS